MPHPDLLVHNIDSLYTINPSLGDKSVVGLIKDASVGFRDGRVVFIGPSDSSEAEEARGAAALLELNALSDRDRAACVTRELQG